MSDENPHGRLLLILMLALTFSTGIIDAIGYLGLDRVFVANMTGNVAILGMALTGAEGLPVVGPSTALGGFILGAVFGGRVLHLAEPGWHRRTTVLLSLESSILIGVTTTFATVAVQAGSLLAIALGVCLGTAMGLQAAIARRVGLSDISTVALTQALSGLAADHRRDEAGRVAAARRLLTVLLLLAGAISGALLIQLSKGAGLAVAAVIVTAVTVIGARTFAVTDRSERPDPATGTTGPTTGC